MGCRPRRHLPRLRWCVSPWARASYRKASGSPCSLPRGVRNLFHREKTVWEIVIPGALGPWVRQRFVTVGTPTLTAPFGREEACLSTTECAGSAQKRLAKAACKRRAETACKAACKKRRATTTCAHGADRRQYRPCAHAVFLADKLAGWLGFLVFPSVCKRRVHGGARRIKGGDVQMAPAGACRLGAQARRARAAMHKGEGRLCSQLDGPRWRALPIFRHGAGAVFHLCKVIDPDSYSQWCSRRCKDIAIRKRRGRQAFDAGSAGGDGAADIAEQLPQRQSTSGRAPLPRSVAGAGRRAAIAWAQ